MERSNAQTNRTEYILGAIGLVIDNFTGDVKMRSYNLVTWLNVHQIAIFACIFFFKYTQNCIDLAVLHGERERKRGVGGEEKYFVCTLGETMLESLTLCKKRQNNFLSRFSIFSQ